jgi:protein TonB
MRRSGNVVCALAWMLGQAAMALAQTPVIVGPSNQPAADAPLETIRLYAVLNDQLATALTEPESLCVASYAKYQACKANTPAQKCGAAPSCAVTFALPSIDLSTVRLVFPGTDGVASLVPRAVNQMPQAANQIAQNQAQTKIPKDITVMHAPTKIPKDITVMHEDAPLPPPPPASMGVAGMAGGSPGGVMGGTAGNSSAPIVVVQRPRPVGPAIISSGVMQGSIIKRVQPVYPPIAKVAHLSGTVVLRVLITTSGTIGDLELASANNPLFIHAAIDAVRQWTYKPYLLNGQPTEVDTTITVNFTLNG